MKREKTLEAMLTITVGFLVLFLIFKASWLLTAAVVVGLIGVFSNYLSEKITQGWMKIAEVLGRINATILLSAVFFIMVTPMAFLRKLFGGKDLLHLRDARKTPSLYEARDHVYEAKDLEDTW
ncbi:MAG: SxtJ family membrane protein [Cytophagaceae bacterium]|nr:SxtJ family membrane protein [Cytophagaceae bacterium]